MITTVKTQQKRFFTEIMTNDEIKDFQGTNKRKLAQIPIKLSLLGKRS